MISRVSPRGCPSPLVAGVDAGNEGEGEHVNDIVRDLLVPGVPLLEKVVRSILVYAFLVVVLGLAGRRELGQWNRFDLVVLLMLSNTVQNAIIGNDNSLFGGLIGAAVLVGVNSVMDRFFFRYPTVDRWVEGEPMVLVEDGKPVASHLAQERITDAELGAAVRRQGLENLVQVQRATLENSGEITIIKRDDDPLLRRLERIEQLLREQRQAPGHGGAVEA
jgi:uncharacterized membrane protein YcaP (DUF421 family)